MNVAGQNNAELCAQQFVHTQSHSPLMLNSCPDNVAEKSKVRGGGVREIRQVVDENDILTGE